MFVAVLGLAVRTADPLTLYLTYTDHIFGTGRGRSGSSGCR